jgi:hypothetical protein
MKNILSILLFVLVAVLVGGALRGTLPAEDQILIGTRPGTGLVAEFVVQSAASLTSWEVKDFFFFKVAKATKGPLKDQVVVGLPLMRTWLSL